MSSSIFYLQLLPTDLPRNFIKTEYNIEHWQKFMDFALFYQWKAREDALILSICSSRLVCAFLLFVWRKPLHFMNEGSGIGYMIIAQVICEFIFSTFHKHRKTYLQSKIKICNLKQSDRNDAVKFLAILYICLKFGSIIFLDNNRQSSCSTTYRSLSSHGRVCCMRRKKKTIYSCTCVPICSVKAYLILFIN